MTHLPHLRSSASHPLRLFWTFAGAMLVLCACVVWRSPDVNGVRALIRTTARTSLVFFAMAYGAQAMFSLWPGQATRWLRQHRRQWGWLLVLSHTLHGAGILAFVWMDPVQFMQRTPMLTLITGGVAYVWLGLMGATSFDRSAAWLSPAAWQRLHRWGSHYLWLSFLVAFAKRVPQDPVYGVPVVCLVVLMALRWWSGRQALVRHPITPHVRPGEASSG